MILFFIYYSDLLLNMIVLTEIIFRENWVKENGEFPTLGAIFSLYPRPQAMDTVTAAATASWLKLGLVAADTSHQPAYHSLSASDKKWGRIV